MTTLFNFLKRFWFLLTLFAIMVGVLALGDFVPLEWKRTAFTASSVIRSLLLFLLPFLVLPFIVTSISHLKSNGIILVISLVTLITLSNFTAVLVGAGVASTFLPYFSLNPFFVGTGSETLQPWFDIGLRPFLSIEITLVFGFACGILLSLYQQDRILQFFVKYRNLSNWFFTRIFIPVLPLYILGTLFKLDMESDFYAIFNDFGHIITLVVITQVVYVSLVFLIGTGFSLKKSWASWKNSLPPALLGFSTLSSLVTMPVTLKAVETNLNDKDLANIAVTTTVNNHVIGECISFTIIALGVYMMANDMALPDVWAFLGFSCVFALAQFSAVAVPGGSAVVTIPLLIGYLDFTPEMVGLVTALSIFMDPIGTAQNVMGNCAFAHVIQRFFQTLDRLFKTKLTPHSTTIETSDALVPQRIHKS